MPRKIVHVVGTGTIGEPLIGLLSDWKESLGIDEITFQKNTPLTTDRAKIKDLISRGARLCVNEDILDGFKAVGLEPDFTTEEAIQRATVVIDCVPGSYGSLERRKYYEKFGVEDRLYIIQRSGENIGPLYAAGINDEALERGKDHFIEIASCNTHNIASLVNVLGFSDGELILEEGRFVCIRRANDISEASDFIPSPEAGTHADPLFGTYHARDAHELFHSKGYDLDLFSSSIRVNSQYMHILYFHLKLKRRISLQRAIDLLDASPLIALTEKRLANQVFSFGRDHGHYGRILNQSVISLPTLQVRKGTEVIGYCFTPQDGNSIMSSISAALWFIYPHSYREKLKKLSGLIFSEI